MKGDLRLRSAFDTFFNDVQKLESEGACENTKAAGSFNIG